MKTAKSKHQNNAIVDHRTSIDYGIDELNLAEFPLASIAERRLDGRKTVVFEEPLFDRVEGKYVSRRLTISGSDRFGLPTAKDDDVLLACMQISKLQDFQSPVVNFSRYEILKMLRLGDSTANYARIATSLRRWKGLTIFSDRAFYDHQHKSWVNRDFGIFDTLYIYSREADGPNSAASSRFTWNEVLFKSFQAGYLKRLDWNLYTSLECPIAKRLYRFLDKRFFHGNSFEMGLRELAVNRMSLSTVYNTAQLKRGLLKGLKELEQRWDLRVLSPEQRFIKQGRGNWVIRFERKRKAKPIICNGTVVKQQSLESTVDTHQLQSYLIKRGIGPASAEELARYYPVQSIKTMIELFDWYNHRGQTRGAGFLVQSIKNPQSIELPKGFESSAQIQLRRDAESNRERIQRKCSTKRERVVEAQVQSRFEAFNTFWKSLSHIEQADFENTAVDRADATKRHGYYRNQGREDPLFEQYRQVILRDHFERSRP